MSSIETYPGARRRTFGVELELLVPWLWEDEPDPHVDHASQLPPVLRLPRIVSRIDYVEYAVPRLPINLEEAYSKADYFATRGVRQIIYNKLLDVLTMLSLPTELISQAASDSLWGVKSDGSVVSHREEYKWVGTEMVSPAERASNESFHLICFALNALKSNYRIMVNETCGLHVHVGDGIEKMPLDHIKRVAGFFWAPDPLLAFLHPPHRRANHY